MVRDGSVAMAMLAYPFSKRKDVLSFYATFCEVREEFISFIII